MSIRPVALLPLLLSLPSHALQPIEPFVASSLNHNPDVLEAKANAMQQNALSDAALGHVLPGVSARGSYTRNQYDSSFQGITITPIDQWDGFGTVTIPLIDAAGWTRASAAKIAANAAELQLSAARLTIESQVAQDYYQVVANIALEAAAVKALEASEENLRLSRNRYDAGVAQMLDVDRAVADVELQKQLVSAAGLQVLLAARSLESSSGLRPDTGGFVPLADDLHTEPPLATFEDGFEQLPQVRASVESVRSAEKQADAQRWSFVPSITGSFIEHGTTAAPFGAHEWSWQALVGATWTLDLTMFANVRAQDAATDAARSRETRTRLASHDAIYKHWETVAAGIARSRSARAGQAAATHAAELARNRYSAGTVVQLDLLQAQRDAFVADVTRIQADADLVNARAQLRLAAGRSLTERGAQ
jgi:outer membrane protein TolC